MPMLSHGNRRGANLTRPASRHREAPSRENTSSRARLGAALVSFSGAWENSRFSMQPAAKATQIWFLYWLHNLSESDCSTKHWPWQYQNCPNLLEHGPMQVSAIFGGSRVMNCRWQENWRSGSRPLGRNGRCPAPWRHGNQQHSADVSDVPG